LIETQTLETVSVPMAFWKNLTGMPTKFQ